MNNPDIDFRVKPDLTNEDLNPLYAVSWPHHTWFDFQPVLRQALTWICAYRPGEELAGFVYLAWDGAQHAFLLEPTVHPDVRRRGVGTELVRRATDAARDAGCDWLHVDYEERLKPFYEACGFTHTEAGLVRLRV
jgi:GNAT superfamily N-acetyltransferase